MLPGCHSSPFCSEAPEQNSITVLLTASVVRREGINLLNLCRLPLPPPATAKLRLRAEELTPHVFLLLLLLSPPQRSSCRWLMTGAAARRHRRAHLSITLTPAARDTCSPCPRHRTACRRAWRSRFSNNQRWRKTLLIFIGVIYRISNITII